LVKDITTYEGDLISIDSIEGETPTTLGKGPAQIVPQSQLRFILSALRLPFLSSIGSIDWLRFDCTLLLIVLVLLQLYGAPSRAPYYPHNPM